MARIARLVVPGIPHHVTQRGNRRETVFFSDADYSLYRGLLGAAIARAGAEVWAYCLMPNHLHVIVTPRDEDGLRQSFAECHRRYTGTINARHGWTGHLWQSRFGSVAMDEAHLVAAVRYVSLNPVRAGLVARAEDWAWSSARAHFSGRDDGVVTVEALLERVGDFGGFLAAGGEDEALVARVRRAETVGRPAGSDAWVRELEARCARTLAAGRRGPKVRVGVVEAGEGLFGGV